jgi:hypothetical protein
VIAEGQLAKPARCMTKSTARDLAALRMPVPRVNQPAARFGSR